MKNPLKTSSYDYDLPKQLIAAEPVTPKNHSRLLVYDRKSNTVQHAHFYELEQFLPECALVFNNTKVIKARLFGKKSSGGKIELLVNRAGSEIINALIRGKVHVGTVLEFDGALQAEVMKLCDDGSRDVRFYHQERLINFETLVTVLDQIGHTPLPSYIERKDNSSDVSNYQSVFAAHEGAVAAPTASLHFTKEQFEAVCSKYPHAYVTLHVGAGTFKPVEVEDIHSHKMHTEYYNIPNETLQLIQTNMPLLAVGTTTTRTVEHYMRCKHFSGEADIFLHPENRPLRISHLLTNFHLPRSTLMMLVASFVGYEKTMELYEEAMKKSYRFYSYGDAMLIL